MDYNMGSLLIRIYNNNNSGVYPHSLIKYMVFF